MRMCFHPYDCHPFQDGDDGERPLRPCGHRTPRTGVGCRTSLRRGVGVAGGHATDRLTDTGEVSPRRCAKRLWSYGWFCPRFDRHRFPATGAAMICSGWPGPSVASAVALSLSSPVPGRAPAHKARSRTVADAFRDRHPGRLSLVVQPPCQVVPGRRVVCPCPKVSHANRQSSCMVDAPRYRMR